jgi:glutaredoxin
MNPFRLFGLIGCPHCVDAEKYLREKFIPADLIVSNDDPVIAEGVKLIGKTSEPQFPVLLYRPTKELIVGFKPEEYERVISHYSSLVRTSAPNTFGGGQQPSQQA